MTTSGFDYSVAAILGLNGPACPTQNVTPEVTVPRRRRSRTVYSREALDKMEKLFSETQYPDIHQRERLSTDIGVPEARIQVWFQNRRSRNNTKCQDRMPAQRPAAKRRKRCSADTTETSLASSITTDLEDGLPTKVPRLSSGDVSDTTVDALDTIDTNKQHNDTFPYCYLPPYYCDFFSQPYFFNPALGHPHYALMAANNQNAQRPVPLITNFFKMPAAPISPVPASPTPYLQLSSPTYINTELSQATGVQQGYSISPALFNSGITTQKSAGPTMHMCVPPLKHATRHSIAELSSVEIRADDDDDDLRDSRPTSPAFSERTGSSFSLSSYDGSDSGFGQELSSDSW